MLDAEVSKKCPRQPTSIVTNEVKPASSRSEINDPYQASFLELAALKCSSLLVTTDNFNRIT